MSEQILYPIIQLSYLRHRRKLRTFVPGVRWLDLRTANQVLSPACGVVPSYTQTHEPHPASAIGAGSGVSSPVPSHHRRYAERMVVTRVSARSSHSPPPSQESMGIGTASRILIVDHLDHARFVHGSLPDRGLRCGYHPLCCATSPGTFRGNAPRAPPPLPMDPSAFARFKDPGPGTSFGREEKQGPKHGRRKRAPPLTPSIARAASQPAADSTRRETNTKRPELTFWSFLMTTSEAEVCTLKPEEVWPVDDERNTMR